jgi:7-cyano-7-deazaguanine synthase
MIYTEMKRAVVLLSGGIDSSTTAAIAKAEGYDIYAMSFDYGQRHRRELVSARMVAESLRVKRHLIVCFDLREIGGSALTADIEVPKDRAVDQTSRRAEALNSGSNHPLIDRFTDSLIPVTYVPARNTIFLSFALGWAEVLEAASIFIGANAIDYSGYPDCRPDYLKAFEEMANLATRVSVEGRLKFKIEAPLLYMTKGEIIKRGTELGLDYSLTWSCYDPQPASCGSLTGSSITGQDSRSVLFSSNYVPCRRCDSCLFRARGFEEAGLRDPLA